MNAKSALVMLAAAAIFLGCATTRAQEAASMDGTRVTQGGPAPLGIMQHRHGPITGEPYSAHMETIHTQTLADGTTIEKKMSSENEFRDSAGRTRREHFIAPLYSPAAKDDPISVLIQDPTTGVGYMLDTQRKTARELNRRPFVPASQNDETRPPVTLTARQRNGTEERPHPKITTESLGVQTMEGVSVMGTRTTMEYPAKLAGNDRPFSVVTDRWFSEELQILVLVKSSDPRSGETVTRATSIDRTEPDAALFQVPADYTITKEVTVPVDPQ
jgi:hypothetical protein